MGKTYQSFGISISILPVQCPMFKDFKLEQLEIEQLENNIIQLKERTEEIKEKNFLINSFAVKITIQLQK